MAWRKLIEQSRPLAQRLVEAILGPLPPVRQSLALGAALRRDGLLLARRMAGPVEAFGLDVFNGAPRPTAWLAGSAQHSGLPPSTAGSAAFGFLLQLLGHSHGWPYPAGGQGEITSALLSVAGPGGSLRSLPGARGADPGPGRTSRGPPGERRRAAARSRCGVDDQCPPPGRDPSRASASPHRLLRRLRIWRYGTAAFKLDYALRTPVPWTAPEAREATVVHVAGDLQELSRAAEAGSRGEVPERPALVVGQHTLYDHTRAPGGHQCCTAMRTSRPATSVLTGR